LRGFRIRTGIFFRCERVAGRSGAEGSALKERRSSHSSGRCFCRRASRLGGHRPGDRTPCRRGRACAGATGVDRRRRRARAPTHGFPPVANAYLFLARRRGTNRLERYPPPPRRDHVGRARSRRVQRSGASPIAERLASPLAFVMDNVIPDEHRVPARLLGLRPIRQLPDQSREAAGDRLSDGRGSGCGWPPVCRSLGRSPAR
jgi:hypothetical protein